MSRRHARRAAACALFAWFAPHPSYAYETDQLTNRADSLPDVRLAANAAVDAYLDAAIRATNAALGCRAPTSRVRRRLAAEIYQATARPTPVEERGVVDGLGFGAYAAFLESGPIPRRDFRDRTDIYGGLTPTESLVVGTVGVCSTINLGGVLVGTDKPDHFFAQGYDYFRKSHWGRNPRRAVRWGTATERGAYGRLTSDVFSFADLHANRRGYTFYAGLLQAGGAVRRGPDGCVVAVRGFDWAEWIDDAYDEVLNPSTYGPRVEADVNARIAAERESICKGFRTWGADVLRRREKVAALVEGDAEGTAPARGPGTDFDALCGLTPPRVEVDVAPAPSELPAPGTASAPPP